PIRPPQLLFKLLFAMPMDFSCLILKFFYFFLNKISVPICRFQSEMKNTHCSAEKALTILEVAMPERKKYLIMLQTP
ncbi:hypothetical protein, partial [Anaerovibrio slackiae]|uniref:hypothetical protein n=1 Tax=Anaerovibrio slackiae TaxID=2652309 RepID=UPI00386EB737